ncbi:uncharacterized protein BDZ99DRAFT_3630 [Mytilinidion resinicola]|uniref:Zn(2)-C6 fungal-type domain-containing protein n=1 Tax=Mytilinidion resinicola TaxID=574789 RepID=A0A6A6Z7V2_9PEZI|nr:uncharacterized protein BDZ99DRAFT_3630 [Mytilinidion resinicola]KAF2816878.1 hypothetical protein BDZ99DRAFT_3630 [Mytilinidion resinicola]
MVNVGGRSKGCSNCRRRRVKCDERRPICVRCERIGISCTGVKETAFIDTNIRFQFDGRGKDLVLPSRKTANNNFQAPELGIPISRTLSYSAVQDDFCILYTRDQILRGGPIELASELVQEMIPSQQTKYSRILESAVMGLSMSFFGSQHRDSRLAHLGSLKYGAALKGLNDVLLDPECFMSDHVLLTVVTMIMYEAFYPTGNDNYLKHVLGLERLLELRGPLALFSSSYTARIFRSLRRILIFSCINMSKLSIMALNEWRREPRDSYSFEEHKQEEQLDFLADWMVLRSERDAFASKRQYRNDRKLYEEYERLLRKAEALRDRLSAWGQEWLIENTHASHSVPTTAYRLEDDESTKHELQVLPIECSNPGTATMLILYNVTLIYILEILDSLPPLKSGTPNIDTARAERYPKPESPMNDSDFGDQPVNLPANPDGVYHSTIRDASLEICRGLKYQLAHSSQLGSSSLLVGYIAVKTAFRALGGVEQSEGQVIYDLVVHGTTVANKIWTSDGRIERVEMRSSIDSKTPKTHNSIIRLVSCRPEGQPRSNSHITT